MFDFIRKWLRKTESQKSAPMIIITKGLITESIALLREARDEVSAHENILYWAGKSFADRWVLTTCIAPMATTTRGSYVTSASENAKVIKFLAENELELLCQVHSHPGSLVGHSEGDDRGAFMPYENFLSIVVPDYGHRGILPLTQCGVHRFSHGTFIRLSDYEIDSTFYFVDDKSNALSDD